MAEITKDSHLDHALTERQVDFVRGLIATFAEFKILTIDLPEELGEVPCVLHGPLTGEDPVRDEEAYFEKRGLGREGESRMCRRPTIQTRKLSVIVGPHKGAMILYTAFGGPVSPREPFDPSLTPDQKAESVKFWAEHALSPA
jgi:hypothetical protein